MHQVLFIVSSLSWFSERHQICGCHCAASTTAIRYDGRTWVHRLSPIGYIRLVLPAGSFVQGGWLKRPRLGVVRGRDFKGCRSLDSPSLDLYMQLQGPEITILVLRITQLNFPPQLIVQGDDIDEKKALRKCKTAKKYSKQTHPLNHARRRV